MIRHLLLAVLALAATCQSGSTAEPTPDHAWLFTSFRGNGDGLHLAYSDDARTWVTIPGPIVTPTVGSKLMRDPHITRGPDGLFHMVWTSGWGDKGIGYASSPDLVTWSEQRYLPVMEDLANTRTCWAPEVYYDDANDQFLIVWSSDVPSASPTSNLQGGYHRAYYLTTKDFETFSPRKMLFDPGFNNIDTTIVQSGDKFYLVCKETDDQPKEIWGRIVAAVADQVAGPYRLLDKPLVENKRAEGPAVASLGDKTILYADFYADGRYLAIETDDWSEWKDISAECAVVPGQRHGSLLRVTRDELKRLAPDAGRTPPAAVLPGVNADPHIAVFGDRVYLYPTTDGTEGWRSTSFSAWSSANLRDWRNEGVILDLPRDLKWADIHAWAPAIATRNGKFYFYYSADKNIGVAVADKPSGPFTDPLGKPLVAAGDYRGMQCIDPMVFVDDDGAAYLYWGQGRCKAVRLGDDMISFDPAAVRDITPPGYNEGPFVHRRGDAYYLTWSEYDTRDPRYSVAYGVSDSPLGPFEKPAKNPILKQRGVVQGAGHHSITKLPGGDNWVIAYHRFKIPGGDGYNRETCLSPLRYDEDGAILPVDVYEPVEAIELNASE